MIRRKPVKAPRAMKWPPARAANRVRTARKVARKAGRMAVRTVNSTAVVAVGRIAMAIVASARVAIGTGTVIGTVTASGLIRTGRAGPQHDLEGSEQPVLPAFLTAPTRTIPIETPEPEAVPTPEAEAGEEGRGGPFRARRRRRPRGAPVTVKRASRREAPGGRSDLIIQARGIPDTEGAAGMDPGIDPAIMMIVEALQRLDHPEIPAAMMGIHIGRGTAIDRLGDLQFHIANRQPPARPVGLGEGGKPVQQDVAPKPARVEALAPVSRAMAARVARLRIETKPWRESMKRYPGGATSRRIGPRLSSAQ